MAQGDSHFIYCELSFRFYFVRNIFDTPELLISVGFHGDQWAWFVDKLMEIQIKSKVIERKLCDVAKKEKYGEAFTWKNLPFHCLIIWILLKFTNGFHLDVNGKRGRTFWNFFCKISIEDSTIYQSWTFQKDASGKVY